MILNAKKFFSESDVSKIENRIRDIEKDTSGEIVVYVASKSARYLDIIFAAAMLLSLTLSYSAVRVLPLFSYRVENLLSIFHGLDVFLLFFLSLFIFFYFLLRHFPSFCGPFISRKRKLMETEQKALQAFYENALYRTKDETGILLLISLLERRIYLLADRGILGKIDKEDLSAYVENISVGIRGNDAANTICAVIDDLGRTLKREFPAKDGNPNELSDRVVIES